MSTIVRVPSIDVMDDDTVILHLEARHANDLSMSFEPEPGRDKPRLHAPAEWRTYHETMHRLNPNTYDHEHNPWEE